MEYIIGVDIGTTSTKSIAFDLQGRILTKKNIGYSVYNPLPDRSEQKPEEIFGAVVESIRFVVDENIKRGNKLLGVSFSSAMHSLIAVDEEGNNLTECIIWADTRSSDYADRIKSGGEGHEIYMRTGTPIHPMSPLCKLAWMRDNLPDIYRSASKFISIKEYIFYKFFGKYVVDYSIASATGLFDIYNLKWNEASLRYLGLSEDRFSDLVSTTYILKGIKSELGSYLGIDEEVPFIIGGSDGCLANLGSNATKHGEAAVTIGTSGAIRIISSKPKNDSLERIFSYMLTENHYVLGGPINNGAILLDWIIGNLSPLEIEEAQRQNIDLHEMIINEAAKVSAGSDGLIFLPYLLGERAPYWDANARGVFFGINIKHRREHFMRAVLEGIMFSLYSVGRALEETTGNIEIIYATGGFAKSELWVQMLSDIFNKRVAIAESTEGSCLGAAVLAMKALGIIENIEEVDRLIPLAKIYTPDPEKHKVYHNNFEIFDRLYHKLKDEWK